MGRNDVLGIQKVDRWVTCDGKQFDSEEEAQRVALEDLKERVHESLLALILGSRSSEGEIGRKEADLAKKARYRILQHSGTVIGLLKAHQELQKVEMRASVEALREAYDRLEETRASALARGIDLTAIGDIFAGLEENPVDDREF